MSSYTQVGTKALRLSEILKVKVVGQEKESDAPLAASLPSYVAFVPPPTSTNTYANDLSKKDALRIAISSLPGYRSTPTINALQPGIVLPIGYASKVVTNPLLSFTIGSADGLLLTQLMSSSVSAEFKTKVIEYINTHYSGSGTLAALLSRMKKQLTVKQTPSPTEDEAAWIIKHFSRNGLAHLEQELSVEDVNPEMNFDAHPGAPYFVPGAIMKTYAAEILAAAEAALVEMSNMGFTKYKEKCHKDQALRARSVSMLSAKHDVYERSEYFTKTRPFGVTPGHLRMIFACIESSIKPGMNSFLDDEQSFSAYKFSWMNGGAAKMVDWILKKRVPGFYPISWGDDQLWIIVCEDGSVILAGPDVSGMDMKVDDPTTSIFTLWLLQSFSTKPLLLADLTSTAKMKEWLKSPETKLGPKWFTACIFFCNYIAACEMLVAKQHVAFRKKGLLSGVNCTTIVDIVASGRINYAVSKIKVPPDSTLPSVRAYFTSVKKVTDDLGFPLKGDSMDWQVIYGAGGAKVKQRSICSMDGKISPLPKDVMIGIPFLGQRIMMYHLPPEYSKDGPLRWPVPAMDPVKLVGNAILSPPTGGEAGERVAKTSSGYVGRGFNCVVSKDAYDVLHVAYEQRRSMGHGVNTDYAPVEGCPSIPPELKMSRSYPAQAWFAKIYAPPHIQASLSHITLPPADVTDASVEESPPAHDDELDHIGSFAADIVGEESRPLDQPIVADIGPEDMASTIPPPPPIPPRPVKWAKKKEEQVREHAKPTDVAGETSVLQSVADITLSHGQRDVVEDIKSMAADITPDKAVSSSMQRPSLPPIATVAEATQPQEVHLLKLQKEERHARRMLAKAQAARASINQHRLERRSGKGGYYEEAEDSDTEQMYDDQYYEEELKYKEIIRKAMEEDERLHAAVEASLEDEDYTVHETSEQDEPDDDDMYGSIYYNEVVRDLRKQKPP